MMRPPVVVCPGAGWGPVNRYRGTGNGTCAACGKPLQGKLTWFCRSPAWCRDLYLSNHDWGYARAIALRRASPRGRKDDAVCIRPACDDERLEVNHIKARNGMGYQLGCHHHQDNLEVLCHSHHLAVTALQRGYRTAKPKQEALL